jgi:hypothetical protein
MARISITEAARRGFRSRATINRDARSGKLPTHEDRGRKVVDVADLIRLYGEPGADKKVAETLSAPDLADRARLEAENERLQAELLAARSAADEAQRKIEEVRDEAAKERDRLMCIAETAQKMLEDQREASKQATEQQRGWLRRVFGG